MIEIKKCTKCLLSKTIDNFGIGKSKPKTICKACEAKYQKAYIKKKFPNRKRKIFDASVCEKICITCKKLKKIDYFQVRSSKKNLRGIKTFSRAHVCKDCESNLRKEKYNNNKQFYREKGKNWYKNNVTKEMNISRNLWAKFKLTIEDYNKLLEEQKYKCKICDHIHDPSKRQTKLCVDHCHKTGKIRSLLCYACNTGLGLFRENKSFLQKAIQYIEEHECK